MSPRALVLAIALLGVSPLAAQITLDATASGSTPAGGADSVSWSHTVGSGRDRILVVGVANRHGETASVTYGGQNLVRQVRAYSSFVIDGNGSEIWMLIAPPTGTATIVVTFQQSGTSLSTLIYGGSVSFAGVDQATPVRAIRTGEGYARAPEVLIAVNSYPGDVIIDCASCERAMMDYFGSSAGQTVLWIDRTFYFFAGGGSILPASGESTAVSWSCGGPHYLPTTVAVSALSLIPASFADLAVTKSSEATISAGENVSYDINVSNQGPDAAQSVTLSDHLPGGVQFLSLTQAGGPPFVCATPPAGATGTLNCSTVSLPSGSSARFTLVGHVPLSTPSGVTITNSASVTSTSTELAPIDNSASASTIVSAAAADVSLSMEVSPPPYGTRLPIAYAISVGNAGPAAALGVTVTDVVPAGMRFMSSTPSQGSCDGTSTVTCTLGEIPPGGTATILLMLTLPMSPGAISNSASVTTANPDLNTSSNTAVAIVTVVDTVAIPALAPMALLLLAVTLAAVVALRPDG